MQKIKNQLLCSNSSMTTSNIRKGRKEGREEGRKEGRKLQLLLPKHQLLLICEVLVGSQLQLETTRMSVDESPYEDKGMENLVTD